MSKKAGKDSVLAKFNEEIESTEEALQDQIEKAKAAMVAGRSLQARVVKAVELLQAILGSKHLIEVNSNWRSDNPHIQRMQTDYEYVVIVVDPLNKAQSIELGISIDGASITVDQGFMPQSGGR